MKKSILLFVAMAAAVATASAQYYYNPYQAQPNYNVGAEIGRQTVERIQAEMEARDARDPNRCISRINSAIMTRDFNLARDWAYKLYDLDNGQGAFYLGLTHELLGDEGWAQSYYRKGANSNNSACRAQLNRLQKSGALTSAQIDNLIAYLRQIDRMAYAATAQISNNIDAGSSSSYSSRKNASACPYCKGTGVETTGRYFNSPNAGSNAAAQGLVGYTNGDGQSCPYCGKYGYHVHFKCYNSNYHSR